MRLMWEGGDERHGKRYVIRSNISYPLTDTVLLRSAVTDGITIGHPCCRVHDCKEPLPNMKAHFCQLHHDLELECSTVSCPNMASPGYHSCAQPECCELERIYYSSGAAMSQLRQRLARQGLRRHEQAANSPHIPAADTPHNGPRDLGADVDEVEIEAECEVKEKGGKKRLKGRFGRLRTFCEVLCVLSCGTIIGRTTMFGSEAPNGIIVSVFHIRRHHIDL